MTTEQYQGLINRFDIIDKRFDGIDQELRALGTKIDDVKEEVFGFASDIHDRLLNRVEAVEIFVGLPKNLPETDIEEE